MQSSLPRVPGTLSPEQLERVQVLIRQENEIRLFLPDVSNFGHHGTTINLMYRLCELGARQIRIIYVLGGHTEASEGSGNLENVVETWPKLRLLIPGLPDKPINQFAIGKTSVVIQTLEEWDEAKNLAGNATLVLTGGWDVTLDETQNIREARHAFQARSLLILQPFAWLRSPNLACIDGYEQLLNLNELQAPHTDYLNSVYYVSRLQPTREESEWLKNAWREQYSCIQTIHALCDAPIPGVEMSPVYFSPGRTRADGSTILFNLIASSIIRTKKKALPEKKPTIIVIMAPRTDKADYQPSLQALLQGNVPNHDDTQRVDGKTLYPQRAKYLESEGLLQAFAKVAFLQPSEFTAATCATKLQEVGKEGIIVLHMGRVPNILYNWLYSCATLPSLFEGNGTASMILNLGLSYFHLHSSDEKDPDYYPLPVATSLSGLSPAYFSQFCNDFSTLLETGPQLWEERLSGGQLTPDQGLATFMLDATNPEHVLYKAFKRQKEVYHSQANDKLLRALAYLLTNKW